VTKDKWKDPIQEVLRLIKADKPVRKALLRLLNASAAAKEAYAAWRRK